MTRSGLGHTFSGFVNYLQYAVANKLTYHASFYTLVSEEHSKHDDTCDLNETAHFFGFHNIFYWSRHPRYNISKIIHIGSAKHKKGCNEENLKLAVDTYRNNTGNSCIDGIIYNICNI
jgi:hypothetical protein